jgi:hypothetical protein
MMVRTSKPISIQNIFPKRAIEALDVGILRRLAQLDLQ